MSRIDSGIQARNRTVVGDRPAPSELHGSSAISNVDEKECLFADALVRSGAPELRRVNVSVDDGRVMLFGSVSSYYLKQLAQESLRPCAIGMKIDNQLKVTPKG